MSTLSVTNISDGTLSQSIADSLENDCIIVHGHYDQVAVAGVYSLNVSSYDDNATGLWDVNYTNAVVSYDAGHKQGQGRNSSYASVFAVGPSRGGSASDAWCNSATATPTDTDIEHGQAVVMGILA